MAKRIPGIYETNDGKWRVDKSFKGTRIQGRFGTYNEAESWLLSEMEKLRLSQFQRPSYKFENIAAKYLIENESKISIKTEAYMLSAIMPFIGHLNLEQVHDESLKAFVKTRKAQGRKNKTINASLAIVKQILNQAAAKWRDEKGRTLLEVSPAITKLPLNDVRKPYPISWAEQHLLISRLPAHLQRMILFSLNTGVRENVVCNLQWSWEHKLEVLGCSVFQVPKEFVKGRRSWKPLICNKVAQSIIEEQRGVHDEFVFTYKRGNNSLPQPIGSMYNNGWKNARKAIGLPELTVHDMRHTVGMRLRETKAREETIADILWHSRRGMTAHYTVPQCNELLSALNKITEESNHGNLNLEMLFREKK